MNLEDLQADEHGFKHIVGRNGPLNPTDFTYVESAYIGDDGNYDRPILFVSFKDEVNVYKLEDHNPLAREELSEVEGVEEVCYNSSDLLDVLYRQTPNLSESIPRVIKNIDAKIGEILSEEPDMW